MSAAHQTSSLLPVVAALDALSLEPFFIKQLVSEVQQQNRKYPQNTALSTVKIRSVFDKIITDNYVEKIGRKYKTTPKLQNLISEACTRLDDDQPMPGSSDDDRISIEKYTTVLRMMESDTSCGGYMEIDDRPPSVRRKRRSSVDHSTSTAGGSAADTTQISQGGRTGKTAITPAATPRNPAKRVRFSDPGPSMATSGLTPAIERYSIQPETQTQASSSSSAPKQSKTPRHRRSLPARLSVAPASDIDPSNPVSGEVRFVSLRQILTPRVQRVLWRNNLSEEINEIEAEKRAAAKQKRNTEKILRERLAAKDKELGDLQEEMEITRQLAIDVAPTLSQDVSRDQTVRELEEEIARLREEIEAHRELTADPHDDTGVIGNYDDNDNGDDDDDFMMITEDHVDNDVTSSTSVNSSQRRPSLVPGENPSMIAPEHEMAEAGAQTHLPDEEKERLLKQVRDLRASLEHLDQLLERDGEDRRRLLSKLHRFIPADSQQPDRPSLDAALDIVLTRLALEQAKSGDAQQALCALSSEVSLLGFEGEDAEGMLNTIRHQFRQARLELEYMDPGENIDGFENSKLLGMLVERVRELMRSIKDRDSEIEGQVQKELALRDELESMSGRLKDAENDVFELETAGDEKDRSMEKLQRALDSYRDEVHSLETLINNLDNQHQVAIAKLQGEMDEAVHDLEGRISEQTVLRQNMEGDVEGKRKLIAELEARIVAAMGHLEEANTELRITRMEKDTEIRRLENEYQGLNDKSHDDVKTRDERIAELQLQITNVQGRLTEAQTSIADLADGKSSLEARLAEEVKRGIHTLETLEAGMRITMAEKEQVVQKLEGRIRELDSRYLDGVTGRDRQIAELREQIRDLQTTASEARDSISKLSASKDSLEARLAEEVENGIRVAEATQAEMQARAKEKEGIIQKLECEKRELSDQYRNDLDNRDSLIQEMRHEVETLQATLADAQASITHLTASKTTLEARLADEREKSNAFVEDMQAEAVRWVARMGDMTNTYRRGHKPADLQITGGGTDSDGDNRPPHAGPSPLTPNSMVRFAQEPLQKGLGRRRFDSGIGVGEDEEHEEEA